MVVCPITTRQKGYTFEVPLPRGCPVHGVVLADQVKSVDWTTRNIEFIAHAPLDLVTGVLERVSALLGIA